MGNGKLKKTNSKLEMKNLYKICGLQKFSFKRKRCMKGLGLSRNPNLKLSPVYGSPSFIR